MAGTLQDRIAQNKTKNLQMNQNGVLEEKGPDLQQLTGQAGLQVAPTDQVSAGTIGANPHQQKMVGSPAQLQSAQKQALDQSQSLAASTRTQQSRTKTTDQEKKLQEKSKDLQDLGGLGGRVDQFIQGQMAKLAGTQVAPTEVQAAPDATLTGLPTDPTQLAQLKDAAKQLLANPQDMHSLLTINQMLGRNQDSTLGAAEVSKLYENATDTLARSGAQNVQDHLQVEDLINQGGFGYDLHTLSGLLNVPEDKLSKMSVTELQQAIDQEQKNEFSRASQTQQQAGSLNLGAAQRNLARQQGRDLSSTGVRASEQDMQRLQQQIQNADQVQFGGQEYQVDKLLQDETISGVISDYLNAGEGTPLRKQLEQTEPGLVQFIKQNQALLAAASDQMQAGATEFSSIQQTNKHLGELAGGAKIPEAVLDAAIPHRQSLSETRTDASQVPVLDYVRNLDPAQQQNAAATMAQLSQDPNLAAELGHLSKKDLLRLDLDKGFNNSPEMQMLQKNRTEYNKIQSATNPDSIIDLFTGGNIKTDADLVKKQREADTARVLGMSNIPQNPNFNQKPEDMLAQMKQNNPKSSLQDVLDGKTSAWTPQQYQSFKGPSSVAEQEVWQNQNLQKAAQDHGAILPQDVDSSGLDENALHDILQSGIAKNWGMRAGQGGQEVQKLLTQARSGRMLDLNQQYPQMRDDQIDVNNIDYLNDALANTKLEQEKLQQEIAGYAGREWQVNMPTLQRWLANLGTIQDKISNQLVKLHMPAPLAPEKPKDTGPEAKRADDIVINSPDLLNKAGSQVASDNHKVMKALGL